MTVQVIGVGLLLSFIGFMLRGLGWRGAPIFAAVAAVLVLCELGEPLRYIFGIVSDTGEAVGVGEHIKCAVKILGLGYLFAICSDICRELGESGIAKAVDVVGRVEIIAVIMPYFEEIIKLGVELIG